MGKKRHYHYTPQQIIAQCNAIAKKHFKDGRLTFWMLGFILKIPLTS